MGQPDYGIFNEFWNDHPNHLPFLNLREDKKDPVEWNLSKSLERLDLICIQHSTELIERGIHLLLDDENWRPHLVGVLASFKLSFEKQQSLIPDLWLRLEKGSWISPQILAVLSMIDKDFEPKAKEILDKGFQVKYSPMKMVEHHSARGPEGSNGASEKVIKAIRDLLEDNDHFGWRTNLIGLIKAKRFKMAEDHKNDYN